MFWASWNFSLHWLVFFRFPKFTSADHFGANPPRTEPGSHCIWRAAFQESRGPMESWRVGDESDVRLVREKIGKMMVTACWNMVDVFLQLYLVVVTDIIWWSQISSLERARGFASYNPWYEQNPCLNILNIFQSFCTNSSFFPGFHSTKMNGCCWGYSLGLLQGRKQDDFCCHDS